MSIKQKKPVAQHITFQQGPEIDADMKTQIEEMLDGKMLTLKHDLSQRISNIQLDLIRQMVQQEGQLENCLQAVASSNKLQKQLVKQLAEENQKLRSIQF